MQQNPARESVCGRREQAHAQKNVTRDQARFAEFKIKKVIKIQFLIKLVHQLFVHLWNFMFEV